MFGYELWETTTGNLIASYEDETAALRAVARSVQQYGPAVLDTVALVRVDEDDEDGGVEEVAAGAGLLARATSAAGGGEVTGSSVAGGAAGTSSDATGIPDRFGAHNVGTSRGSTRSG